ncbi:MAG: hypothetical protein RBG13Loki_3841 [Promethearchaeota archaeon CR_4]|nr:MAG: hypothetical protein RBG13Loki_3841 [Candidatus Lokiarchaeota archaeon CR_4]
MPDDPPENNTSNLLKKIQEAFPNLIKDDSLENKLLEVLQQLREAPFGNADWFFMLNLAQQVSLIRGFQQLLSLEDLTISLFPHQEEAVSQILQQMQGSALIADEVGLGKTITACTVLSELKIRDLINSILIIVPPSLVEQWCRELREKFNFDMPVVGSSRGNWKQDQFITSLNLVTLNPEKILDRTWDLVIIDEVHRIKSRSSKIWQTINQLNKKYMLFLTATPMENYLEDIYNLVTLLKPGLLGTQRNFRTQFAITGNKRACKDPIELRRLLNNTMIRRRREDVQGIFFPERVARTIQFDMTQDERKLYDQISDYVITSYKELDEFSQKIVEGKYDAKTDPMLQKYNIDSERFLARKIWLHKFTLIMLQRRICSCVVAASRTLSNMIHSREEKHFDMESVPTLQEMRRLSENISQVPSIKYQRLKTILDQLPHKGIVFTEFKDSLDYLAQKLQQDGYSFTIFDGSLPASKRAEVVKSFEDHYTLMVSTDAGSEGLNLQFANSVINWDLPWNPMRIEQRIGRIYRLTQQADRVFIFNLASKGTIEEYVLDILHEKIGVFRTILGDLNHLLGSLVNTNDDGRSVKLESEIMSFFVKHGHSQKLRTELEQLVTPVVEKINVEEEVSRNVLDAGKYIGTY